MNHSKTFIIFLVINLVIGLLVPTLFGANIVDVLTSNGRYAYPIVIVLIGVLLGYFASFILGRDKERKSYFVGQLLSSIAFFSIIVVSNYNWWEHNKNFANIDGNEHVMNYFVNDDEPFIRAAFSKLESSFINRNDFELKSFHVDSQDTLIEQHQDTVYNIYFTYFLSSNKTKEKLSKIVVFRDKATLVYKDVDNEKNPGYKNAELHSFQGEGNVEPIIDTMLKDLPFDRQKTLKDSINKLLKD